VNQEILIENFNINIITLLHVYYLFIQSAGSQEEEFQRLPKLSNSLIKFWQTRW